MTFVVTENCIKCKYQDCVEVCPVDCFYEGPNFLVINPDECIDCALCEPECPANAIFSEDELPEGQEVFIELNTELSQKWPNITQIGDQPADRKNGMVKQTSYNTWKNNSIFRLKKRSAIAGLFLYLKHTFDCNIFKFYPSN